SGKVDYKLYFFLEVSGKITSARFFENEEYLENGITSVNGTDLHLRLDLDGDGTVTIKCAISYESLDGAQNNFCSECKSLDFNAMRKNVGDAWESALDTVTVEGSDEVDKKLFYTCLYHTLLDPRVHSDTGDLREYTRRTMFSGWDVYRSQFPLLTIISPQTVSDGVQSLLDVALQKNSSFPRWELMGCDSGCMTGDPGVIVMADAYLKGICDFDIEKAYAVAIASAKSEQELFGKPFSNLHPMSKEYCERAYVALGLSHTLEFLMANYALLRLAEKLDRSEDAYFLRRRVESYRDNFNSSTGFMGSRDENGCFIPVCDEYDTAGCIESNIFQQSFFAPYDVEGLAELFGKQRLLTLLEKLFEKADFSALWNENYNHSNEPCHNLTHYFAILGSPERTQYWTRRVQKEAYRTGAFGFCGNEDVGQLSAWYVLSAMGFAQICMGDEKYYLNTPLFSRAEITLDKKYHSCALADRFVVECDRDPLEYPYIDEAYLDG
ncbi:MAG: GH92 family glycosyl hydrolase, partial [Clostridia bacterium]|nr:GH92 family glycosyl hydrolase [Clostridia bacterium]